MKKILTTMTAMSLTLQASDRVDHIVNAKDNSNQVNYQTNEFDSGLTDIYAISDDNNSMMGSSGSFACNTGTSGVFFCEKVGLSIDADGSGDTSNGDTLLHTIVLVNNTSTPINSPSGSFIDSIIDSNLSLNIGSVFTNQGFVYSGNGTGQTDVGIATGNIAVNQTVYITFKTTVVTNPADGEIITVPNQAIFTSALGGQLSDDSSTPYIYQDATLINVHGLAMYSYSDIIEPDFTEHYEVPTPIIFPYEYMRVSGVVGGIGYDLEDCFQFENTLDKRVNQIILEDYQTSGNNNSTNFFLIYGMPDPKNIQNNAILVTSISTGDIGKELLNYTLSPNNIFSVCLSESEPGQSYSLLFELEIQDLIYKNNFEYQQ